MELVRSLIVAVGVGYLFDRLHIPAGALLGAMIGVAAVNLIGFPTVGSGSPLRFAAFVVIGWELGSQVTRETLLAVKEAAIPILVVVVGLVLMGVVLAIILTRAGIDPVTAYLAASPGGLSQMVVLSSDFGANPVVVSVVHLIRILAVLLTAPVVARLLSS